MKPYSKDSHDKAAGFMFDIKLLTLCMLRGLSNNRDFHMATEMKQEKVGKYDDVVFIFEDSVGDKRSFLVQCKHTSPKMGNVPKLYKATLLSDKDKHFGIIKYLRSYLECIKENQELGVVDGLVLFTNREVDNKMIEDKDLIKLGDNDREFMKFCLAPRWVKDDVMTSKHQDGVEKVSEKQRRADSFFSLSEKFVNKLKPILLNHYLNEISFNFFTAVLYKKKIELSWDSSKSAFDRYQSSVYYKILDLEESSDRTFSIKGLKEDFVKKADYLRDFRQKFVQHLGSKFININPNIKVFDIESLQKYFKTCHIVVEMNDTFTSITDLSLEEIISDTDLKNFQKLFVLAAGQPNVVVIENVIVDAVKQLPVLQNVNPRDATKFLISHVHEWADSREGVYLDLNRATEIINHAYSESMLSGANFYIWGITYRNILFEKSRLDDLNNLLQANKSSTVQISCKGSAKLLMLQLRQTSSTKDYLYLDFNLIDKWMGEGIDLPKFLKASESIVGVVIDLTSYRNDHSSKIDSFICPDKKMIVIVPHNTPIDKLRDIPNISAEPLETDFKHLSSESRDYLCSKKIFNVHGRMRSIDDLLPNIVDLNISNDVLNDLLLVNELVIGEVPNSLSNLPAAYFKTYQIISPDYFAMLLREKRCKFAISVSEDFQNTEESLLSVLNSIDSDVINNNITLEKSIFKFRDDDLEKFYRICEKNNTSVIYRIHIDNGSLVVTEIFNPNYYIERQFMVVREVTFTKFGLNEYFLKTNGLDIKRCLIIARESPCSSTDEWEKSAPVFVCRVEEAEDFYKNKCLQTDPKFDEVHWLNFHGTEFKLVKSHGSMAFIREYENINQNEENHQRIELSDENKLFDEVHSNVVLICDEAGTGKSTTLVSMCNKLMDSKCVYMIDLKNGDVKKVLDNLIGGNINEEDCVLKLLTSNDDSALLSFLVCHLLQKRYEDTDGLVLIFDGIDEIIQKYQYKVIKTIKYIANETKCRICIASRKTCQPLLEDQFCQLAITINAMSFKDQNKLINKHRHALLLHQFYFPTETFSFQMKNIFGDTKLAALPLYLRLMYEISMRDLEKRDRSVSSIKHVKQLFDKFVKIRYTIYYSGEVSDRLNEHNRVHAEFAFGILFPDDIEYCDAEHRLIEQRSTYLSIGMLYSRGPQHFDFIHQTFCEYFCAMYLVGCLNKRKQSHLYKTARRLLGQDWFWPRRSKKFKMLAQFVDAMLEEDIRINGRHEDLLGRSIEHICAYNNRVYKLKPKIHLRKDILGRTPLHYAIDDLIKVWALFFKSDADIECYHDNVLHGTWNKCEGTPSSLYSGNIAFESSEWNRIVNAEDIENHSCLFYAAEMGNWDVCILLLCFGADCKALTEPQRDKLLKYITDTLSSSYTRKRKRYSFLGSNGIVNFFDYFVAALIPLLNNKQLNLDTDCIYGVYGNGLVVLTVDGKLELSDCISILHFVDKEHLKIIKHLVQLNVLTLVASYVNHVVEWGHIETFKYLQEMIKPEDNPLPVHMKLAILYNRASIVKFIWGSYKELATDTGGRTPLMVAADCGNLRFVEYFCENGLDVNVKTKFGDTALHYAVESCTNLDLNIIKYLVEKGANVHLKNRQNITTLDIFIDWVGDYSDGSHGYQTRFECIRFLVQDCKAESKYGDQAFREQIVSATHDTVNACVDGSTLLHKAVSMSAHGFVAYLLYKGADVYAKDVSGRTVLDISFSGDLCDRILFRYATQCSQSEWQEIPKKKREELILGDTLLHMSARRGDNSEVNRLIANGAMFDAVNNEGLTPEQCSIDKNVSHTFDEVSQYFQKVKENDLEYIEKTFSKVSKNNIYRDKSGKSLLHWALHYDFLEMVNCLLKNHAVFLEVKDIDGMTSLHYAVKNKSLSMTYLLLKHGADFNPMDKRCRRLLEDEEKKKQSENPCVATLRRIQHVFMSTQKCQFDEALGTLRSFQSDADFVAAVIHSRDRRGNTLLHHAAAGGNIDIVKFVLSNGGCYNPLNNCRKTPLDVTRSSDIYTLLSFLDDLDVSHLWKSDLEDYREAIVNAKNRDGELSFNRTKCCNVGKWLLKSNPNLLDMNIGIWTLFRT